MSVLCMMVALVCVPWTAPSLAHEVRPAIADVTVSGELVRLEFKLNLEAFVAKIDLDGVTDTDETESSPDYDRLRALSSTELERDFRAFWPEMRKGLKIISSGAAGTAELLSVQIPDVGNIALPRTSRIVVEMPAREPVRVGWARRFGNLIVRQQGLPEKDAFTGLLSGGELSPAMTVRGGASESGWRTFVRYIGVGFDHIIPQGLDHILFILGLFFLAPRLGPLLWQVTAFTLAHTVTLALGALDIVSVPAQIVEPLIAASIVYVAVENIFTDGLSRWRPVLIFGFGLLHGLGFASVLGEFGLPDGQFIPALIGFNVGVEVGQLAVIAVAFLIVGLWFRNKPWYRKAISIPASCLIALVGVYWIVERTLL